MGGINMVKLPIKEIRAKMQIAQDLILPNGRILLSEGTQLTEAIIKKIQDMPFSEVYIKKKSLDLKSKMKKNEIIKAELEKKLENLSKTIKNKILNLKIDETEMIKNIEILNDTIEQDFTANSFILFNSIFNIKKVDEYLFTHSINVAILSFQIGKWLGLKKNELQILIKAGLLHDIGKLKIDKSILDKPGKLTKEEFEEVKKHSLYSKQILSKIKSIDNKILESVAMHHEKLDGTGYPYGLKEDEINVYAKIISISDVFDAMTSDRVYHKKKSLFEVIEMFENGCFGKLDYGITRIFISNLLNYYIGENVYLNTGDLVKIIQINSRKYSKPLVLTNSGKFIDMTSNKEIKIVAV